MFQGARLGCRCGSAENTACGPAVSNSLVANEVSRVRAFISRDACLSRARSNARETKMSMMKRWVWGVLVALHMVWVIPALSEAADLPAMAGPLDASKEAARLFGEGDEYFKNKKFREAYDAFQKSLAIRPSASVMGYAASCLKELGQEDEAMDLAEKALDAFPNAKEGTKKTLKEMIEALQNKVGTISLKGDTPEGAEVFIDGRSRGVLNPKKTYRARVGTRSIVLRKQPFEDIEGRLDVIAKQENTLTLRGRSRQGRLRIAEKHNWVLHVELDGKDVGITPFDELAPPGEHIVRLHGYIDVNALEMCSAPDLKPGVKVEPAASGVKVSSWLATETVNPYEDTELMLGAEELDASLKVDSLPSGAILSIDSEVVGTTPWEGRRDLGRHRIEVNRQGYLNAVQEVKLVRRKQQELTLAMEKEMPAVKVEAFWTPRRVGLGAAYGIGVLGFGMAAVTGGMAWSRVSELEDVCERFICSKDRQGTLDSARTLGTMATAGLIVGAIGGAGGTVILLLTRSGEKEKVGMGQVQLGLGSVGLGGRF